MKITEINEEDVFTVAACGNDYSLEEPDTETLLLDVVTWTSLSKKQFPRDRWLIQDLLPNQGSVILAAISGEKKTWVAMEACKSVVTGADFLNDPRFKTQKGSVLYIDMEMSQEEFQRRGKQLGLQDTEDTKMFILNTDNFDLNEMHETKSDFGNVWLLKEFIHQQNIRLVVIDTFRAVAGGLREEKAEEIRAFFNQFKDLKNDEVCVMWLDHFRKPNNLDGNVPKKEHLFASQDKTASVEVLLMMRSESGTDEISVYQRKNRLGKEIKPFLIKMEDKMDENGGFTTTALEYAGEIEADEKVVDIIKDAILIFLNGGGKTTKEIIDFVLESTKGGQKNTRAALKQLVQEGLVHVNKKSKPFFYSLPAEDNLL